jgi:hypothetical protein
MENLNCGLFAMLIATHIGHTFGTGWTLHKSTLREDPIQAKAKKKYSCSFQTLFLGISIKGTACPSHHSSHLPPTITMK